MKTLIATLTLLPCVLFAETNIKVADLGKDNNPKNQEVVKIASEYVSKHIQMCQGKPHMMDNTGQMFEFSGKDVGIIFGMGFEPFSESERLNGTEYTAQIVLSLGESVRMVKSGNEQTSGKWTPVHDPIAVHLVKFKGHWQNRISETMIGNGLSTLVSDFTCSGDSANAIKPEAEQEKLNALCQSDEFKDSATIAINEFGRTEDLGGVKAILKSSAGEYQPPENLMPPIMPCNITVSYGNGEQENLKTHIQGISNNGIPSVNVSMF